MKIITSFKKAVKIITSFKKAPIIITSLQKNGDKLWSLFIAVRQPVLDVILIRLNFFIHKKIRITRLTFSRICATLQEGGDLICIVDR